MLRLYHGTTDPDLVPVFGGGGSDKDFGSGFYLTESLELAKEWAWSWYISGCKGFVYAYDVDLFGLNILTLDSNNVLSWVAELVYNRKIWVMPLNFRAKEIIEIFRDDYKLDTTDKDIIIGHRADNIYFKHVKDFLERQISVETLTNILRQNKLGIQYCLKSERAFESLRFVEKIEVDEKYRGLYLERDNNYTVNMLGDRYVWDIMWEVGYHV